MGRKNIKQICMVLFAVIFLIQVPVFAADKGDFKTTPQKNNGQKWRIGYYQGGNYDAYVQNLKMIAKGLMELDWIKMTDIPDTDPIRTLDLWKWLANHIQSDYIQFVEDAFYSAEWDKTATDNLREKAKKEIIKRLNEKKDIDFIIAMGTWAGQDLANDRHHTPVMVVSTSDPVKAGIIKSESDSGFDHVHARVDPLRYERQVRIFHDIIGFNKLGMAYKNTVDGRSYAALDKVELVAQERGFEIVSVHIDYSGTLEEAENQLRKAYDKLGKEADAIYVTLQAGINERTLPDLIKIVNKNHTPTFSMAGSKEVKAGVLLSISQVGFKYVGLYHAQVMAKVFNGAKPRDIDQHFEDPPKIAINLKSAEIIGFDPPVDLLGAADEIYQEIEVR